ncbi:hypothetical protein [Clostridium thermopalmarium]|uniref:Uncharacterized protein n=1 Tax=Clostridium thermopalmarium DSM 5974 TaxID=1121340 RepID=A0A2T0AZI2_9CLOT|nr:hypothetical protein [Clostridium thermopalmarium]PRR76611.1 hypothetical protein CPAL_02820 [Clostridium thermopalmarium DSM 5974]PVZ28276.1 hypothetical protein LX19_00247 [Clostridium thermopalmarium DSM 5974]
MIIKLFIKTTDNDKVAMVIKCLMSYINEDNIKYKDIKTEPYWKFHNTTVAEIQLELYKPLDSKIKEDFLNRISNRWLYFGEEEVLSSVTMEGCRLSCDLEMVNIFFS